MTKTICIYHANCCDGMGAAWVVHRALNEDDDIEFIPSTYQAELPDVTGAHVIIVDFSYKQDQMRELAAQAKSILVLDHHKTAQQELAPLLEDGIIQGKFDMNHSGAMLAWMWFFPQVEPPALIKHIQDRDLWRFDLPGTREIQSALYSFPMDFETWDMLMSIDTSILYKQGIAIDRAHKKNVQGLVEFVSYRDTIAGFDVPVLNCNYMFASDAGHELAKGEAFSATYYDTEENRKYSLRSSEDGGIDVSEIAAKFGGGGHRHAAGFKIPLSQLHELK
ncbi:phosphohydrolase [Vibrio parahaemolyticus]|nr:phosphohydrolase [Vibrio parahaemolyticus]